MQKEYCQSSGVSPALIAWNIFYKSDHIKVNPVVSLMRSVTFYAIHTNDNTIHINSLLIKTVKFLLSTPSLLLAMQEYDP